MEEIKWYKVTECIPPMDKLQRDDEGTLYTNSDYVIVWTSRGHNLAYYFFSESKSGWFNQHGEVPDVLSWTPLPPLPTE